MTSSAEADIVPDSERRGLIGALPRAARPDASLIRLDRPIGVWLLFWPGAWAVALAGMGGGPLDPLGWSLIGWLALGAFAMRGAGCVWNDIVDRDLDRRVERTRLRPLASGRVPVAGAWALIGLLLSVPGLAAQTTDTGQLEIIETIPLEGEEIGLEELKDTYIDAILSGRTKGRVVVRLKDDCCKFNGHHSLN